MQIQKLEKKIKNSTMKKDYDKTINTIADEYIKQMKKMLKYKNVKYKKTWYLYDYLKSVKNTYGRLYEKEIDEIIEILYSNKFSLKKQISFLIENCECFNEYKL